MRRVCDEFFKTREEGEHYLSGLINSKIEAKCEKVREGQWGVYVINEDDIDRALEILKLFKTHPKEHIFTHRIHSEKEGEEIPKSAVFPSKFFNKKNEDGKSHRIWIQKEISWNLRKTPFITMLLMLLCGYILSVTFQEGLAIEKKYGKKEGQIVLEAGYTPILRTLMIDDPKATEELLEKVKEDLPKTKESLENLKEKALISPSWTGLYQRVIAPKGKYPPISEEPMFEKIRDGEYWRLISPVILHGSFLHLLFNMLWLWAIGKEIERRLRPLHYIALMVIIGVISNVAQYLLTGPAFLGFSGVVCGLVGYVWAREQKAPWEGYPIPKGTFYFLFIFVIALTALQIAFLVTESFGVKTPDLFVGNGAHVVGGIVGYLIGRTSLFVWEDA